MRETKKKILIYILFLVCMPTIAFAWNANGHRVIAEIAYHNLNPDAQKQIAAITYRFDPKYKAKNRFLFASTWPDKIKYDGVAAFDSWHFINYSFNLDNIQTRPYQTENVVWAINQSEYTLTSPNADNAEKAIALSFLIHFVGDVHQPLHCTVRYSKKFSQGDKNGILFLIQNPTANNLHSFWDEGLGLLPMTNNTAMSGKSIEKLAKEIQQKYPEKFFGDKIYNLKAKDWAKQSFQIAKNFAYNTQENAVPSAQYITQGQILVKQQLALAGYRLANLLNRLFSKKG